MKYNNLQANLKKQKIFYIFTGFLLKSHSFWPMIISVRNFPYNQLRVFTKEGGGES